MPLSLKTKFTVATSLVVLGVVTCVSWLFLTRLSRQVIRQADDRAHYVAQEVLGACEQAVQEAAERGETPASTRPEDEQEYVRRALDNSSTLNFVEESALGYSPIIYEITVSDRSGLVLKSSDPTLRGRNITRRAPYSDLVASNFPQQLKVLYGKPMIFEVSLPFVLGDAPFGNIHIGLSSTLLR